MIMRRKTMGLQGLLALLGVLFLAGPAWAETEEAAPPATEEEEKRVELAVEGELANIGAIGLVPWENRFGLTIGVERLGEIFYGVATPQINYTNPSWGGRPFTMSFGVPLRFEILDARADQRWDNAGRFRKEDWDEASDFAQVIRYITYGGKEKHLYLDINAFKSSSIGHGTILKRYNPNLNLNTRRISAQFDGFFDYGGVETYLNDITGPNVLGGLLFLKPLSIIDSKNYVMRSFSIGFTVVADLDAPLRNRIDENDIDSDGRRKEILVDQDNFQPDFIGTEVVSYGLDVEVKLVDTDIVDWKTYVDYSFLETGVPNDDLAHPRFDNIPTRGVRSKGFAWGHLVRINTGVDPIHALRIRTELRRYDYNYLPSYFDSLYEVQRVQYFSGSARTTADLATRTKLQQVLGRDPDGPGVTGFYFESSWRVGHYFALSLGLEMNNQTPDDNLFVHMEVPHLGSWQFIATYHRRTRDSFGDLFVFDFADNDVFILKTRYGLHDTFHLNLEALTPFGIGPESLFRNTIQVNLNAEFGFSY